MNKNCLNCISSNRCHGEKGNVVHEMAKDKNVLAHSIEDSYITSFVRSDGEEVPNELSKKLEELNLHIYEPKNKAEKFSQQCSYGNYFAKKSVNVSF